MPQIVIDDAVAPPLSHREGIAAAASRKSLEVQRQRVLRKFKIINQSEVQSTTNQKASSNGSSSGTERIIFRSKNPSISSGKRAHPLVNMKLLKIPFANKVENHINGSPVEISYKPEEKDYKSH